uniref:Ribulose bisphosphate carboxylase small subunit n=6 Tax=Bangiaceae TaxID=31345 RepID=RBS_PYRDN|nr:ribulose-1,5-bisphosphate carboxylase/oxygenase small subunit [Neoporphyra dentata]Q760S6.1 RecName: Full=Ribulose bisphosphate carboxylase small subunit; Short=RuBisCO small subunit [Neoporphyra dentata]BAF48618.1 ribulose-1,5-bisphosphate carboxylase/oxygenase small subunit [Porphyra sp. DE001]WKD83775.1 ribulose-1,5-bisphosphate carboxylase/oxygenase small subunit [Neoporphyra dentata]BAC84926.1 ribulose 1,5-bisphosphate carboxylase/oxygenase small subunit [Neoporphyra dentata]BAF48528.1
MRLTQGTFSFLPDLTDEQINKQLTYIVSKGLSANVEYTDDPHPRNSYWELWGLPLFDVKDASAVMYEISSCRKAKPNYYVKVNAFDNTRGIESCVMSFIVNRPANEPGFLLQRQDFEGRTMKYSLHSYATEKPEGARY